MLLHGFPYLSSSVVKPTRRHSHPVSLRRRAFFVSLILTDSFPHLALFRFTSSSLCLSRSSPSFVMCRAVLIYVPRLPPPTPSTLFSSFSVPVFFFVSMCVITPCLSFFYFSISLLSYVSLLCFLASLYNVEVRRAITHDVERFHDFQHMSLL